MSYDNENSEPNMNNKQKDLDTYVRLRTVLDSLELGAIKYFLKEQEKKGERFDEINSQLMPIIDWLWNKAIAIECPEGYMDCKGVCVPYPCPDPGM
jgi:hypothetical protein